MSLTLTSLEVARQIKRQGESGRKRERKREFFVDGTTSNLLRIEMK